MSNAQDDLRPEESILDAAIRLATAERAAGNMYPYANGPLTWTRAAALAQVSIAVSLERIADALERAT